MPDSLLLSLAFDTTNIKNFFDIVKLFKYILLMILKVGNIYRNIESNIPCFISYDGTCHTHINRHNYVVTWCFKSEEGINHLGRKLQPWEEITEGPDGYKEYNLLKWDKDLLFEINKGYLQLIGHKEPNKIILNWIPQHCFLTIK
jgi:hypothetical protein